MANKDAFEAGNAKFAATFDKQVDGTKPLPPGKKALVLACMDARLHPEQALGLSIGDAHCVRNAGGRASDDALRSIAISQRLLGTQEVYIIHHTDCGMLTFSNDDIRSKIKADLGNEAGSKAAEVDFLPFPDLNQSVKDDISIIKSSPLVAPGTSVFGYVYDVAIGELKEVA